MARPPIFMDTGLGDRLPLKEVSVRSPADVPATDQDRGRYSARRKTKAILRLLRGEDIDVVSYELGVTAATVECWRDHFSCRRPGGAEDTPARRA